MAVHPDGECPVVGLLPQGPVNDVDLAVATAAEKIAAEPERGGEIGAILVHMLDHGTDHRPKVARAIAELVPELCRQAAARVRGYLADRGSDPLLAAYPDWYTPDPAYEELALAIALGLLDPGQAAAARDRFAVAQARMVLNFAAGYAALGPEYADEALTRLAEGAVGGRAEAEQAAAAMAKLDAGYHLAACQMLESVVAGGVPVGLVTRPLTALAAEAVPVAVRIAIASLRLDPASYLSASTNTDLVGAVRAAGEQYASQLDAELWRLARDGSHELAVRLDAAAGLPQPARAEAEALILGILGAPLGEDAAVTAASPVHAAVAEAWRRIEAGLAAYAPALLGGLGVPATRLEIRVAEAKLGYRLPEDFAASCLRHRGIAVPGADRDDCMHWDVTQLPDMRGDVEWDEEWHACVPLLAEGDGSYVVLDLDARRVPGRLLYSDQGGDPDPASVRAPNWLSVLERFADNLEAGRYSYDVYDETTGEAQLLWE